MHNAAARAAVITIAVLFGWAVIFKVFQLPAAHFSTGLSVITIFFVVIMGQKELVGKDPKKKK